MQNYPACKELNIECAFNAVFGFDALSVEKSIGLLTSTKSIVMSSDLCLNLLHIQADCSCKPHIVFAQARY